MGARAAFKARNIEYFGITLGSHCYSDLRVAQNFITYVRRGLGHNSLNSD